MAIAEIVDVSITETEGSTELASFDTPAIVAAAADTAGSGFGSGKAKEYTLDTAGRQEAVDDWGGSSAVVQAFDAMLAQEPRPASVYVIERDAAVAVEKDIVFSDAISTGHSVSGIVNGVAFGPIVYATSTAATLEAVATAIAAIEGVDTAVDDDTDTISVAAEDGWPLSIAVTVTGTSAPTATVTTTEAGHNVANDLAEAIAEDDTNLWYGVVLCDTDKSEQLAAAAYIEGTEKMLWLRTGESATKTGGGTTSLGYRLNALNYRRTLLFWHHDLTENIDAAAMAGYLAYAAGSIQLCNRGLVGVTATPTSSLSAAEVTVLEGRKVNSLRKFGPRGMIRLGVRVDGGVIEATRDLDWLRNELRQDFLTYLSQTLKPPYDRSGFSQVRLIGEACARRAVTRNVLRGDEPVAFTVPNIEDVGSVDQSNRVVSGCKLTGTLLKGMVKVEINVEVAI